MVNDSSVGVRSHPDEQVFETLQKAEEQTAGAGTMRKNIRD